MAADNPASELTTKGISLRNRPLPFFGQNALSRGVERMLSALELSAAIAHGCWATSIRVLDRRRATIVPALAGAPHRSALATRAVAAGCGAAISIASAATRRGSSAAWRTCIRWSVASAGAVRTRVARLARATNHFTRHLAIGAARAVRISLAAASRGSIAVASFAAKGARRGSAIVGQRIRQAMLFAGRQARFAATSAGGWLRKFAGTEPAEEVFELDIIDLVPLEERLLAGIGSPRLPSFEIATSNDAELEPGTDERLSDVCSPAVVRLAKMSGQEARVDCSPVSVTASTWRPVRMSRARFGARG